MHVHMGQWAGFVHYYGNTHTHTVMKLGNVSTQMSHCTYLQQGPVSEQQSACGQMTVNFDMAWLVARWLMLACRD